MPGAPLHMEDLPSVNKKALLDLEKRPKYHRTFLDSIKTKNPVTRAITFTNYS